MADIWGKRDIFTTGLALFAISSLLCGFSVNAIILIILRVIQGIGSAMIFCTNTAIIASVFPTNQRGMAIGMNAATVYLVAAIGPSVGGFITQGFGWTYLFVIPAVLAIIILVLSLFVMKERWRMYKDEPFDLQGSIIYSLAIMSLIYGLTILPKIIGFLLIAISILLLLVLTRLQQKAKYPVFNVNLLLKNKVFRMSSAAALINYAATFPIAFLISIYLQEVKMLDVRTTGMILIMQPILQVALSPFMGRLSDKIQPRYLASAGMSIITLVLFVIALPSSPHYYSK